MIEEFLKPGYVKPVLINKIKGLWYNELLTSYREPKYLLISKNLVPTIKYELSLKEEDKFSGMFYGLIIIVVENIDDFLEVI